MATFTSFEQLDCWKVSTDLRRDLAKVVKKFPEEEKYELTSQIRRASRSVTNNIAEGFGRFHYQEFVQFCRVSRGSLTELSDHLIIANDEQYIDGQQLELLRNKINNCIALVNGFINYLLRAKKSQSGVSEPFEAYTLSEGNPNI